MPAFASMQDRCTESYSLSAHLAVLQGALHGPQKGAFLQSQLKPSTGQGKRPEASLEGAVGGMGAGPRQGVGGRWARALHSVGEPVLLQVVSGVPLLALHSGDKLGRLVREFGRIRMGRHSLTRASVQ